MWPPSSTMPLMHQSYRDANFIGAAPLPDGTFLKYGTLTSQCGSVYRTFNRLDARVRALLCSTAAVA